MATDVHIITRNGRSGPSWRINCTCGDLFREDTKELTEQRYNAHILAAIRANRANDKAVAL